MKTLYLMLGALLTLTPIRTTLAEEVVLVERGGSPLQLVARTDDPAVQRAVKSWETFLRHRDLPFVTTTPDKVGANGSAMIFTTDKTSNAARETIQGQRYNLSVQRKDTRVEIVIRGASGRGVDAGGAALLSRVGWWDGKLTVPSSLTISATPFFPTREATICPTGRAYTTRNPAIAKKTNFEQWPKERTRQFPDYLRACGFNSIQVMELIGGKHTKGYGDGGTRENIYPVIRTLADAAHANGMTVSQYIWGSADGYDWKDPAKRPARESRYRELAKVYGPVVDHIVTHWIDPGHEGGYVIPQEATAFLLKEYRKHNPDILATVDTWGHSRHMNAHDSVFWEGDPRAKTFLDETFMPREIGVALERSYNAERVAKVRAAGRRVGIWGWYIGDYEMVYGIYLQLRALDKYFTSLPDDAAGTVDWLSIEMCYHGLPSQINYFVAGQKMWTPKRPIDEIVLDYCRSVYGLPNAEAMRLAFQTVDAGQKDTKIYGVYIPHSDKLPVVRNTPEFRAQAKAALAAINSVRLAPDRLPNFPVVASPAEDIKWLHAQLEALTK
jgi:hypothetical protein